MAKRKREVNQEQEVNLDSCLLLAEHLGLPAAAVGSNYVFSPLSVRAALSLAAAGSGGETLQQMLTFLGSATVSDLNSSVAALLGSVREPAQSYNGRSVGCQLSFVNGIWVDQTMDLKPSFQETATAIYGGTSETVDFRKQAQKVAVEVNDFVAKATNGLIKNLIPISSVNENTRIILANALHFKGPWVNSFDKSQTRKKKFHLLDGSTTKVPFMKSRRDQFISEFDGFKVLRLPYRGQKQRSFSMLIFLPDNRDGLSRFIQKAVSEPNFLNLHFPEHQVKVGKFMIPKFKLSSMFEATNVLRLLGLKSPFGGEANFSEMVSDPIERLHISSVHHKATVEVEEEGTVAAAATGMGLCGGSSRCAPPPVPPVNFEADHPFMFAIVEEVTGAVLFLGHVSDPSKVE